MARSTVRVVIDADAKGFEKGFTQAQGKAVAFGAAIGTMAGNIAYDLGRRALTAVKDFAQQSITAASDLTESVNAINVVFGESAEGVLELGKSSAESLGMAEASFNQFAVRFSAFAKTIAEQEGRDVVDVVDEMTTRIADFASVHNLSMERAAEVAQSTMAGQTEVFRQFGGDVSDAAVQAKGLELGLKGVGDELTEQEKQLIRYQLFMEQTADTQGDFANTSDEFANSQRILTAQMEDAKAVIGESLLPVMADLFKVISDNIHVIVNVGEAFLVATGLMNEADAAMSKLERTMGEDFAKSADGLFTAFAQGSKNWRSWIAGADEAQDAIDGLRDEIEALSSGELTRARDGLDEVSEAYGWSTEQTEAMAKALNLELARRLTDAELTMRGKYIPGLEDVEGATEGVTTATDIAADAVANFRDEQEQTIDPMFAYRDALAEQEEAQDDVTAAMDEYGEGSPEHLAALEAERQAWKRVTEAEIELATTTGQTKEEFRRSLEAMGIYSKEEIDLIIAEFDRINAYRFASKRINVSTVHTSVGGTSAIGGIRHEGGPVKADTAYIVGGPGKEELFVPGTDGRIVPNAGNGAPVSLNGNGHARELHHLADGTTMGPDDLVASLLQWERRNGPLPFRT